MWLKSILGRKAKISSHFRHRIKSDYARPTSGANPVKGRLSEARKLALGALSGGVFIAAIISVWYWIFASGSFRVDEIRIVGVPPGDVAALTSLAHDIISRKKFLFFSAEQSLFLVPKTVLGEAIKKKFPVKRVEVKPVLPHMLAVNVEKREPHFLATPVGSALSYLIDDEGVAIAAATSTPDAAWWRLKIPSRHGVMVNEKLLNDALVRFVNALFRISSFTQHNFRIISLDLSRSAVGDAIAQTDEGWQLYLSLNDDVATQVGNAGRALQEMKEARKTLHYIDARISTRIYYQ